MAESASEEDLVQLEDLTPEVSIHIKQELQECVVCIAESAESFDIYNTHTASGTLLHTFLRKLTDTDIPSSPEFAKYICKICLFLVNDLEKAEMEYNKLKETFKSIISKNPLFSSIICDKSETDAPQCSQICVKDLKKETDDGEKSNNFQTTVKLEPLNDEDNCKEYEIQYTETKWGTVLVSRKGDELVQERPDWAADVQGGTEPPPVAKTKAPAKRQKPKKPEVEIPANMIILENGEKGFQCSICQRQFKQKGNYNRHVTTHTGVMPFECTICQRRFNRKDHLLNHVRTHTGEKPFECNFCLLKFNQKGSIIKHIRTHTGQEPFECNICQRRFKQRPHLNSHIRTHTGEKPYECKICQRRFIESSKLKIHLRTHTGEKPYTCTYCNRQFNQRGNLQSHLRTHTGEKPYECTVCQRRFNLKHHLRDHISTHTGEKPYECSVCKQKFNYKHVMQNHLRVMHPPEVFQELYGTDAPNFEDNVNSDSNVEDSVNFEGNFDDTERNLEVDGNSKASGVNSARCDVNSERSFEGSVHDESSQEVSVEPSIEVTVKAEPMDFMD